MKSIGKWIQSQSRKFYRRGNDKMGLEDIKEAMSCGDIQLVYEFINNEAVLNEFVNGDPHIFYDIIISAISVDRRRIHIDDVNQIYDDIILQFIKAAKELHFGLFDGKTILMVALDNRMSYDIIDAVLEAGSDVNAASSYMTPLMYAVDAWNEKNTITELINRGADINCRNRYGWTPLFYALHYNYDCPDYIAMLLRAGSNVHDLDYEGKNVLMIDSCHCLKGGDCIAKDSIDVLLKYGVSDIDLKHCDNEGNSVLHETYCKYIFYLAIKSGVSIKAKNNRGQTPLLKNVRTYFKGKLNYLLKFGANIHSTDLELNTAVHLCVLYINKFDRISPEILDMFMYHGADIYARNINNLTPVDIIMEENYFINELAYVIPKYIILFHDKGFDVAKNTLQQLCNNVRFSSFIVECKKELDLMRETFVADGLTFYEFCILKRYYKSKCVNISLNVSKDNFSKIRELFPIYGNVIIIRIKDNFLKKREFDSHKRFERITFGAVNTADANVNVVLNYDCLYHIGRYLNYKEMFNIFCAAIEN